MRHSPGHKSFTIFKNDFSLLASIEYFKLSLNKINPFSIFLFPACSKIYSFWKLKYQWNRSHDVDCSIWHCDQCQNECHSLNQLLIGIKSYVLFFSIWSHLSFFPYMADIWKTPRDVYRLRFTASGEIPVTQNFMGWSICIF